jgi:PAS domain-containing protein
MGTKHPDAFGRPAREHWAEIWDAAESIHRRVFAGETVTLENHPWTLVRNGRPEETFFTSYFTPVRDETGAVAGELVTAFETTEQVKARRERRRVEQALRESEARLRDVLDGIGEAFYALDHDLRFLHASRKALEIWGKAAEDLIGRTARLGGWPGGGAAGRSRAGPRPRIARACHERPQAWRARCGRRQARGKLAGNAP